MTDISELIERVKAATGPDRELDALLYAIVADHRTVRENMHPEFGRQLLARNNRPPHDEYWLDHPATVFPAYTASIDAALALAERVLPGCVWTIEADACWLRVLTEDDVAEFQGNKAGMGGKWTPLAIVLALLTALQSTHSGQMK
jgi:hypothetical protein